MRLYYYIILLIFLGSCSTRQEVVEATYPDGKEKIVIVYEGTSDDRVKVEERKYYDTGQIELKGLFNEQGQRHGKWQYWYKNGNLWSELEFKNGKREGLSRVFFENGKKRYEGKYKDDKQAGKWLFWNEKGEQVLEKDFDKEKKEK